MNQNDGTHLMMPVTQMCLVTEVTYLLNEVIYVLNEVTYLLTEVTYPLNEVTYVLNEVTYLLTEVTYVLNEVTYVLTEVTYLLNEVTYVLTEVTYVLTEVTYLSVRSQHMRTTVPFPQFFCCPSPARDRSRSSCWDWRVPAAYLYIHGKLNQAATPTHRRTTQSCTGYKLINRDCTKYFVSQEKIETENIRS